MPRIKKPGSYLNIKLDQSIYDRLVQFSEDTGSTKTTVAERALTDFMNKYENGQETLRRIEDGSIAVVEVNGHEDN